MADRRYDFAAIEEALRETESRRLAEILGINDGTIRTWRRRGLSEDQADRVACAAGYATLTLWPDWGQETLRRAAGLETRCVECDAPFAPSKRSQIYCTARCRNRRKSRDKQRRRYQSDPEWAERQRERNRAKRNPRVARIKSRAYYREHADEERAKRMARYYARKEAS